jgi:O-antigen ligase
VFSLSPSGLKRITHVENDQPRSELWLVAWRMAEDHPVAGVGLNNFQHRAGDYVRRPGALRNVELYADRQLLAHNSVLEILAGTGLPGALLYVGLLAACVAAALRAARRFDARREPASADLARAIAVATIAMLSASAFLSIPTDQRTWLLLALGPTLLGIASRAPRWAPSASTR